MERMVRRRWKYYRDTKNGNSKWVLDGRNWVTKWDGGSCCIIGINGERGADYYGTVWEARRHVERLSPPNSVISESCKEQ